MATTRLKCPVISSHLRCWHPLDQHPPWLLPNLPLLGRHCLLSQRPLWLPLMGENIPPHHPHTLLRGPHLGIAPPLLESALETKVDSTKPSLGIWATEWSLEGRWLSWQIRYWRYQCTADRYLKIGNIARGKIKLFRRAQHTSFCNNDCQPLLQYPGYFHQI